MKLRINVSNDKLQDVKLRMYLPQSNFAISGSDETTLYIADRYRSKELVCRSINVPTPKYEMEGPNFEVYFYSMLLNSEVGELYNEMVRPDHKTTIQQLGSFPFPEFNLKEMAMGSLMESYILSIDKYVRNSNPQDSIKNNLKISSDFLILLRNYYIYQLYLPEEFKKKGIDIIGGWGDVTKAVSEKMEEDDDLIDLLIDLIHTLVRKKVSLLDDFNKMKVYQIQIKRAVRDRLFYLHSLNILKGR